MIVVRNKIIKWQSNIRRDDFTGEYCEVEMNILMGEEKKIIYIFISVFFERYKFSLNICMLSMVSSEVHFDKFN